MTEKSEKIFLDLVKTITQNNESALEEMTRCLKEPEKFFDCNSEKYEDRDIDLDDFDLDESEFYWLSMVNILEDYGYLVEIDWKSSSDEFLPLLQEIAETKNYSVFADLPFIDDELPTNEALSSLNNMLKSSGKLLICLDIDSDCYDLTLIDEGEYQRLKQACASLDQRVYHDYL